MTGGDIVRLREFRHVGIVADDVEQLATFYRDVIGLEPIKAERAQSPRMMPLRWFTMGPHELHIVQRDPEIAADLGVSINPSLQPHFALLVDDLAALRGRLDSSGTEWVDWGRIGISGLNQIFVRDPDGNVVEFEQLDGNAG
jgi:catechol 2,3-dioxygenase-like lactoylglutathione lyase family enzyme